MKTIEQASLENSKLHYTMAFSEELHKDADIDFRNGVEFAQRWIPLKEELPINRPYFTKDEKLSEGDTRYIDYVGKNDVVTHEYLLSRTHWRPIEIK